MSDLTSTVFGFWRQTAAENVDTSYNGICVTSVFRREVEENDMMERWDRQVVPKRRYGIATTRCVITQKNAILFSKRKMYNRSYTVEVQG
jgi:hypothetical protein